METKTYFIYEWHEFEKLVKDNLGHSIRVVELEEWNNDSDYKFDNVKKKDAESELFINWGLKDVEKFINTGEWEMFHPSVSDLLTYMVWKDMIPEGNYLISVCW